VYEDRPHVLPERVTESYAIAVFKRLVLWVVDGHTPVHELEHLSEIVRAWGRQHHGTKNVALVVIHAKRSTMSAEERRPVLRMIDETKHDRLASATVVLASGMLGALHRSILTGFSLLVPSPHPTKVFGDVESAIAFLHPYIETACGPIPTRHIAAMVDDLLAEIRAPR
jgi:hypothetical protein